MPGGVWTPTKDAHAGCVSSNIPGPPSEKATETKVVTRTIATTFLSEPYARGSTFNVKINL